MNDETPPAVRNGPNAFDACLDPTVPTLEQVVALSEDELLDLTRRIRVRQLAIDLNNNEGKLSDDPEMRKIQLGMIKDLDSQATKIKMIGAKEKENAGQKEAVLAVAAMLRMLGDNPMRRDSAIDGTATRVRPTIEDMTHLKALELVPNETQVGVDDTTYESFLERDDVE